MKKIVVVPLFIVLMSFSQCDGSKFDKKAPILFLDIYVQDWVGGRPGSSGTIITLITEGTSKKIVFDSIYFHKKAIKLESQLYEGKLTLTGNFIKKSPQDRDIIMSSDQKKEFGNKPPVFEKKIPFELTENEAIISYFIKGKKHYYKLTKLKKIKTLYYP